MAPIIKGLIDFITTQLQITVWDGEIPRTSTADTGSRPIKPATTATLPPPPPIWPAINLTMPEAGFTRTWTFEDAYDDVAEVIIHIWSTTREAVEAMLVKIEALLARTSSWKQIQLAGGPSTNPFYVIQLLLMRWTSLQEEEIRTGLSQLLYRGDMYYLTQVHGAIATR